ncbi:relaxase domain-containing protein [Streptomyces sp. NPDC046931]|uniref:relaxase domain-containing protein n=1 Tax=Streptomyces sp. NPDC046931 TaxID=3154806 RepID=UPI0033EE4089
MRTHSTSGAFSPDRLGGIAGQRAVLGVQGCRDSGQGVEPALEFARSLAGLGRVCQTARGPGRARFRHYEARSGMPLLHDHLVLSVKAQRPGGKWGSVHSEDLFENTVAASALCNEIGMAEVCEALGLASEPRTGTAGRRPVMEIAGVPHELIRWTSRRSDQIAACRTDLEHEYVTAVDDDGNPKFAPEVSEQARAKLNRIAAKMTRPPKQQTRPLAQLRAWWKYFPPAVKTTRARCSEAPKERLLVM